MYEGLNGLTIGAERKELSCIAIAVFYGIQLFLKMIITAMQIDS